MPRALLSVSDKTGLVEFARRLAARGYSFVSTGGTARALEAAGLAVTSVSAITRFPEMMDGRVKTLHPAVHGGILARRDRPDDLAAAERHGIGLIDLVAVNLYPFEQTAASSEVSLEELIEQIDIGGPSLVRAAAKNFRDVLIVVSPADYPPLIEALDRPDGPSLAFRFELARRAFAHTARYDAAIARMLSRIDATSGSVRRVAAGLPERLDVSLGKIRDLRYGENPHQVAAWYAWDEGMGFGAARILQGKELSYTNLLDLDAAARVALELQEPAAAIVKHTNPCAVATGASLAEAYVRARETDPAAAFGGVVAVNRAIDEETARAITATFIEAVVAPGVEEPARPVLATKANLRVVVADLSGSSSAAANTPELRSILGAIVAQRRDRVVESAGSWATMPVADREAAGLRIVTKRAPTGEEWKALRFAWTVCAHVKSNAVLFASPDRTLGIGAGQMSRVDAVRVAVMKAGDDPRRLAGSAAASDAFFPFRDGVDAIAAAGATSIVQPGGSVRDGEVIAAADEHNLAMVFTGRRHFRH